MNSLISGIVPYLARRKLWTPQQGCMLMRVGLKAEVCVWDLTNMKNTLTTGRLCLNYYMYGGEIS